MKGESFGEGIQGSRGVFNRRPCGPIIENRIPGVLVEFDPYFRIGPSREAGQAPCLPFQG